jgi:peptidoglycan/xylan/chitin deacetylase (PgdA/CDA1 family)
VRHRVFRPPYVYRWAILVTALATAATLAVSALHRNPVGDTVAGPAGLVAQPTPLPTTEPERVPADLVQHAAQPGHVVALTFDDGPHPEYTPQVLALLTHYRAVATFCVVGAEAQRHPDLVRTVAEAGMGLCAHTVTHDENLPDRPQSQIEAEVAGSAALLRNATGAPVRYFRAPAGNWSTGVQETAARNGMRPLSWSVDSRDWRRPGTEQIVATVQAAVHPGAVILMHDGGGGRDQTVAALARLLPWLVQQGYRFALPT